MSVAQKYLAENQELPVDELFEGLLLRRNVRGRANRFSDDAERLSTWKAVVRGTLCDLLRYQADKNTLGYYAIVVQYANKVIDWTECTRITRGPRCELGSYRWSSAYESHYNTSWDAMDRLRENWYWRSAVVVSAANSDGEPFAFATAPFVLGDPNQESGFDPTAMWAPDPKIAEEQAKRRLRPPPFSHHLK